MLLSLTTQLVAVAAALMVPLIFTEQLSPLKWMKTYAAPLVPPPPPAAPAQHSAATQARSIPTVRPETFQAPAHIPDHVKLVADAPALPDSSTGPGVPGGTGTFAALSSLLGDSARPAPLPPQPKPASKPVPPEPPRPMHVGGDVQAAKLLRQVIPAYPALARSARMSGTVRLVGIIGKDGRIQNLQLVSGPPLLIQAAIDAVKQWVYRPTLLNGQPVEVIAPIDVVFTLSQ